MGKKVSKAVKSVTKAAKSITRGALGVMSGGLSESLLGGGAQGQQTDSGLTQALNTQAIQAQNAAADLTLDNIAQTEAGGTAAGLGAAARRRRKAGASVTSSLGLG